MFVFWPALFARLLICVNLGEVVQVRRVAVKRECVESVVEVVE